MTPTTPIPAPDVAVERPLEERHLDLLQDVLDAKDAMLAAGIEQADFPTMFKAFAALQANAAEPVGKSPLTDAQYRKLYIALQADQRAQKFVAADWFAGGIAMAEAAHGIGATPPLPAPARPVTEGMPGTDAVVGGEDSLGWPDDLEQIIDAYVEDYEMIGEAEDGRDACYTPNANDRALIKDAIMGLLADSDWDIAWGKHIAAPASRTPAPGAAGGVVPEGVLRAISSAGLTLLKTQHGYQLRRLGPITAQNEGADDALASSHPAPAAGAWQLMDTAKEQDGLITI